MEILRENASSEALSSLQSTARSGSALRIKPDRAQAGNDLGELFLAELKIRRKRLKSWLRLIDQEAMRQSSRRSCGTRRCA